MKLTFPDGSEKEFKKNSTGKDIAKSIGERLAKDAVAIKVDNEVLDLSTPLTKDATIKILTIKILDKPRSL